VDSLVISPFSQTDPFHPNTMSPASSPYQYVTWRTMDTHAHTYKELTHILWLTGRILAIKGACTRSRAHGRLGPSPLITLPTLTPWIGGRPSRPKTNHGTTWSPMAIKRHQLMEPPPSEKLHLVVKAFVVLRVGNCPFGNSL
jgi:hypothetical protein